MSPIESPGLYSVQRKPVGGMSVWLVMSAKPRFMVREVPDVVPILIYEILWCEKLRSNVSPGVAGTTIVLSLELASRWYAIHCAINGPRLECPDVHQEKLTIGQHEHNATMVQIGYSLRWPISLSGTKSGAVYMYVCMYVFTCMLWAPRVGKRSVVYLDPLFVGKPLAI